MRYKIEEARQIIASGGIPYGPRTEPCTCGDGKHAHSGDANSGRCRTEGCRCTRYRADVAYELAAKAIDAAGMSLGQSLRAWDRQEREKHYKQNPRKPGEWSLGPSDAGGCRRAIWYKNLAPEGIVLAPTDMREARIGSLIHREAVDNLQSLYPWQEFEQEVYVPGLDRPGKFDRYDEVIGEVEDVKTAGDWRWDTVMDDGVGIDVWKQLALYALALIAQGRSVKTLKASYLKRCNGHDYTETRLYDQAFAEKAQQELVEIATALDIAAASAEQWEGEGREGEYDPGDMLPRDRTGPGLDKLCDRCPFRIHCWNMDEAEELGRSPQSLTILGREPDDPTVVQAIWDEIRAKALVKEAEEYRDSTKVLVDGLDPRRYGDGGLVQIAEQQYGGSPDYKTAFEHAKLALSLPPDEQPHPDEIVVPKHPKVTRSIAKKTAKSVLDKERKAAGLPPLKVGEDVA